MTEAPQSRSGGAGAVDQRPCLSFRAPLVLAPVLAAAAAARPHLNAGVVVLVVIIAVVAWAVRVLLWPLGPCGKCHGSGKNAGSSSKRWGRCRACGGSGTRQRFGAGLVRRAVSRKKD